jgi:GNAT superfamily N-acetyltransferase
MMTIVSADLADGETGRRLGGLLQSYHRQTELEKAANGVGLLTGDGLLPRKYQEEIDCPAEAFASSRVFIAQQDVRPVGMVVLTPSGGAASEVKRLWVEPSVRGAGVGSALLNEAILAAQADNAETVRLTVWEWREPAVRSYLRLGFRLVPSWEERAALQCMELRLTAG